MRNSNLITSRHFCCNSCTADVAITQTPGGDLVYECQNRKCGRCVSVDAPQALAIRELLSIATMQLRTAVQA